MFNTHHVYIGKVCIGITKDRISSSAYTVILLLQWNTSAHCCILLIWYAKIWKYNHSKVPFYYCLKPFAFVLASPRGTEPLLCHCIWVLLTVSIWCGWDCCFFLLCCCVLGQDLGHGVSMSQSSGVLLFNSLVSRLRNWLCVAGISNKQDKRIKRAAASGLAIHSHSEPRLVQPLDRPSAPPKTWRARHERMGD